MASTSRDDILPTRRSTVDTINDESVASPASSPSCTQSSSTLTSAGSTWNSSASPSGPLTPPSRQDRSRTRHYGEIGRVPLHRRGTSKTYERLEDLLREAGYKETRVFTPEAERAQATHDDHKADDTKPTGMGVVVDFLANLFPGPGRHSRQQSTDCSEAGYSPPPSPLVDRNQAMRPPVTPTNMASTMDSFDDDDTPKATRQVSDARARPPPAYRASIISSRTSQVSPQRRYGASDLSSRPSEASLYRTTLAHPRPSRAKAYLQHMASTASIQPPQRPNSTPVNRPAHSMRAQSRVEKHLDDPCIIFGRKGNGEGEEDHHGKPPLPNTWLETVARAVLMSGSGIVGGPKQPQPTLRPARSSLSQGHKPPTKRRAGPSEHTSLAPPPLLTMLERGRAGRSESEVTRTRVVCRSAPGSRTSSLVRGGRERHRGRADKRRQELDKDRLPSLARTQTEDDPWNYSRGRLAGLTANEVKNLYLSGRGLAGPSIHHYDDENEGEDETAMSESSDEGEIDLARILVHPKRQQSIRSLRKHLHQPPLRPLSANGRRMDRGPSYSGNNYVKSPLSDDDDWGHEFGSGWTRRAGCGEDEDDATTLALAFGDFNNRTASSSKRVRPSFAAWGGRS